MSRRGLPRFTAFVVSLVLLLTTCNGQQDKNPIELVNGGYENILIAIAKEVPEDPAILENLQAIFTDGSSQLFSATNNRVYWRSFTILVPPTWSSRPDYEIATIEAYENANILVTNSNNDRPLVLQFSGCGEQGRYMELSRRFVTGEASLENEIGKQEKVVVRQFAKLRWGVFDEHYDPGSRVEGAAPWYVVQNPNSVLDEDYEGTRCSSDVFGDLIDTDGHTCTRDPSTGEYQDTCRFVPHTTGQTAKESLMFQSNIYSIEKFCDVNVHNFEAPNPQNLLCDYQSVWEVIRKSSDFLYGRNPPMAENAITTPEFRVVQHPGELRVVLVLDVSDSMRGERFRKMIQGTKNYILNVAPDGASVGIVQFSTKAEIKSHLVKVTDLESRDLLVNDLPPFTLTSTCIGCGIRSGIDVLRNNGSNPQGGFIILLSDGRESPLVTKIVETLDEIEEAGVIIHTIAFFPADNQLEGLAVMTGGTSAACPDGDSALCVVDAFAATITRRAGSIDATVPSQILGLTTTVQATQTETVTVVIDADLGIDTVITAFWAVNDNISISVTSPDGIIIDNTHPKYDFISNCKMIIVKIDNANSGTWIVSISNDNNMFEIVDVVVTSKPASADADPVTVTGFLGTTDVNFTVNPFVPIFAHIHSNYQTVPNAEVTALVEDGTGVAGMVDMQDNGRGADVMAGDGVYSGYFLNITGNGRYGVSVNVSGISNPTQENDNRFKRNANEESVKFTRLTSGGVFQVQNYVPGLNIDILAPSKITDFTSTARTYGEDRIVNLTWTAVGDDFDQGTAAYYELRFSKDFTQLRQNFSISPNITDTHIVNGNLSEVAPSGTREYISILLPDNGTEAIYSFAIRAWDEASNAGRLSNIVSVSKSRPQPISSTNGVLLPLAIIIIVSLACAMFLAFVVAVIICCCKRSAE